jgi:acyl dehydratase
MSDRAGRARAEDLLAHRFAPITQSYTERDVALYGLGLGLGLEEGDPGALRYLYERDLQVLPSFLTVLAAPGFWWEASGLAVDWRRIVHAGQTFEALAPLPTAGTMIGRSVVRSVTDKGPGVGAIVAIERTIEHAQTGTLVGRLSSFSFLRGDGGLGSAGPQPTAEPMHGADGVAPIVVDSRTSLQTALIYRLSGDLNPLHADPAAAATSGFPRPILHGLATFGIATRAVVKALCGDQAVGLKSLSGRFSAPVFPGETIRTEIWPSAGAFRASVVERNVEVLKAGRFTLAA